MKILSKLPVKSFTRFRCVRKLSFSVQTSSPSVSKHQQNNLKNNNLNLLVRRMEFNHFQYYLSALSTEKGQNFALKENIHLPCNKICGPCNGLLCLELTNDKVVALWNPSTKEIKFIQHPPSPHGCSFEFEYFGYTGFGFDSKYEDYKVVRFVIPDYPIELLEMDYKPTQVHLYSLKTDSWKQIPVPDQAFDLSPSSSSTFINGFCYWIASGGYHEYFVFSFDFANERFSSIPLPNIGGSLLEHYDCELLDFNGSLGALVYPSWRTEKTQKMEKSFDLWVMNNGTWVKEFSIESVPGIKRPLGFWKNGKLFLESSNNELLLFDPVTRGIKNLGIKYPNQIVAYVESMVSINGKSELEEDVIREAVGDHHIEMFNTNMVDHEEVSKLIGSQQF